MQEPKAIVRHVCAALERDPRINLHRSPIAISLDDGDLTLEGEVEHIIAKKLALQHAARGPGVKEIVDRLRIAPAEPMEDREINDHVRDALLQESALGDCSLRVWQKDELITVRDRSELSSASIEVEVNAGVVTLNGEVPSLSHKRLAGVLSWWVPGSCDVINGLEVTPVQNDNDDEITDAVLLVLQKTPFVDAGQIVVGTRNSAVTLTGLVRNQAEKQPAEYDAWYVFGVDQVINQLTVRE